MPSSKPTTFTTPLDQSTAHLAALAIVSLVRRTRDPGTVERLTVLAEQLAHHGDA